MKVEGWMFAAIAIFLTVVTPVYWFMSHEIIGTVALAMSLLLFAMVAVYLFVLARKMDERLEDRKDAEIIEGADELAAVEPAGTDIDLAAGDEEDEDSEDSLTFSNGVIEKIVALAMRDVPGVVGMKGSWFNRVQDAFGASDTKKGVTVEVTPESAVRVNISVLIEYGAYAPQVFEDVKKAVVKQVTGMTGLEVAGVNLRIEDVLTREEFDRSNKEPKAAEPTPAEAKEQLEE